MEAGIGGEGVNWAGYPDNLDFPVGAALQRAGRTGAAKDSCVSNQYFGDYVTVAVFLVVGLLLVGGAMAASRVIAPRRPGGFKEIAYESGIEPIGGGWNQSHIRYYVFALLFLIFDVEAVFIFPWAVRLDYFKEIGRGGLVLFEMIFFVAILILGLLYAIRKGVLRWE